PTILICSFSVFLFISILLQHLIFTLFPYTTLFRSHSRHFGSSKLSYSSEYLVPPSERGCGWRAFDLATLGLGAKARQPHPRSEGDRKSTRLNSSHQIISYAVFCLKKKIRKQTDRV